MEVYDGLWKQGYEVIEEFIPTLPEGELLHDPELDANAHEQTLRLQFPDSENMNTQSQYPDSENMNTQSQYMCQQYTGQYQSYSTEYSQSLDVSPLIQNPTLSPPHSLHSSPSQSLTLSPTYPNQTTSSVPAYHETYSPLSSEVSEIVSDEADECDENDGEFDDLSTCTDLDHVYKKFGWTEDHFPKRQFIADFKLMQNRFAPYEFYQPKMTKEMMIQRCIDISGQQDKFTVESVMERLKNPCSEVKSEILLDLVKDIDTVFRWNVVEPHELNKCYTMVTNCKKTKFKVDTSGLPIPKRSMNAFMLYGQKCRSLMAPICPNLHNAKVSKQLGKVWKALCPQKRQRFIAEKNKLDSYHKIEFPAYKYKPVQKQKNKRAAAARDPSAVQPPKAKKSRPAKKKKTEAAVPVHSSHGAGAEHFVANMNQEVKQKLQVKIDNDFKRSHGKSVTGTNLAAVAAGYQFGAQQLKVPSNIVFGNNLSQMIPNDGQQYTLKCSVDANGQISLPTGQISLNGQVLSHENYVIAFSPNAVKQEPTSPRMPSPLAGATVKTEPVSPSNFAASMFVESQDAAPSPAQRQMVYQTPKKEPLFGSDNNNSHEFFNYNASHDFEGIDCSPKSEVSDVEHIPDLRDLTMDFSPNMLGGSVEEIMWTL